jgi:ATP-dependent DNA helicase RecQ
VPLRRQAERAPRSRGSKAAVETLPDAAHPLFEALRAWRAEQAREQGVPAYIVFGDATLRGVASRRPRTLDELAQVSGVGAKKLETYGEDVLAVVAAAPTQSA